MRMLCLWILTASIAISSGLDTGYICNIDIPSTFADLANSTINGFLSNMSDPVVFTNVNYVADNNYLIGGVNISKISVAGLKQLVASRIAIDTDTLAINMTFTIPELTTDGKYWSDLTVGKLIPLYGEGRMNVYLQGIQLGIRGNADLEDNLKVRNVTIGFTLEDANFNLNGLFNNPEFSALVSTLLNDNFVRFVDKYTKTVSNIVSPAAEEAVNEFLKLIAAGERIQQIRDFREMICKD